MARLNADPHKRAEYLMKHRQWGKKKEDEKLLRTIQHEKCNEGTVKGHEEMCVGIRSILCHPFTMLVSGPTSCGKIAWVLRLIDNIREMVEPVPSRVWYYYGEYQHAFNNYASVHFEEGLPQLSDEVFDGSEPSMIVIDDQMSDINQVVADIFTKISHHGNISILHLTQNLFDKNKYARTISLNAHYLVLFKNPRDAGQFSILARQMYPSSWKFAEETYRDATERPFGYLFVDLKPQQDERYRLRTNIFPGEMQYVYVRK